MPKVTEGTIYSKKYSEQDIQNALQEITSGVALREVSKKYKVPRATLQFRRSSKFKKTSLGPNPYLTNEEETAIVNLVLECSKKGFPKRKEDIQFSVKTFLDKAPRKTPFKNNCPGEDWYKSFLRRHPNLSERTSEAVTSASSAVAEKDIRKWFVDIYSYLESKEYSHILNDPTRIFNADETCFNLCPKTCTVLAPKGAKNVYEVEHASSKQNITVLFTFSANGVVTPPLIIFPGKRLKSEVYESVPKEWGVATSDSGWMKTEIFNDYVTNVLHPYLLQKNIKFPVILFIDGHSTHITYEISNICKSLDIILICLYPNATRILQPADVAAFKPIKTGWKKSVLAWRRENLSGSLKKDKFAPILNSVIKDYAKSRTIQNGFKATGLYPYNPDSIDFSKCLGGQVNATAIEPTDDIVEPVDTAKITYKVFKSIVAEVLNDNLLKEFWKEFNKDRVAGENEVVESREQIDKDYVDNMEKENNDGNLFLENAIIDPQEIINDGHLFLENKIIDSQEDSTDDNLLGNTVTDLQVSTADSDIQFDINNLPIVFSNFDNQNIIIEEVTLDNDERHVSVEEPTINDHLTVPQTPQRKGKRNSKRSSYVITGSVWREQKKADEDLRIRKDIEKKERIEKRKQKQEEKAQQELEKKRKKLEKQKNIKPVQRKRPINKKTTNKENLERQNMREYEEQHENTKSQRLQEINENKAVQYDTSRVVRNLFKTENINIVAEYILEAPKSREEEGKYLEDLLSNIGLNLCKNNKMECGLCYSCTNNVTPKNFGIKCSSCVRLYHIVCMKKHNIHKSNSDIFQCLPCLKKMTQV